jgi:sterol desaturase/sphingolipid hydroxylase (fatty acid hydroxylase superfamily)
MRKIVSTPRTSFIDASFLQPLDSSGARWVSTERRVVPIGKRNVVEAFLSYLAAKVTLTKIVGVVSFRLLYFGMLAGVLVPLERLIPFHARQRLFRPQLVTDFLHYFFGGLFIIAFVTLTYFFLPILTSWADIHPVKAQALPVWAQLLLFESGWTFLGYWLHRYAHYSTTFWRLHSVHESTEELDWLSAFRVHPLEPVVFHTLTIIPLWFMGISLPVVIGYKLYSYVFTHVQHSNVVFPIGPLKYILPTSQFHRWHHARVSDANGRRIRPMCNFGAYPVWDLLFGTLYLPKEKPTAYGNAPEVPKSYLAQLAYPFNAHEPVLAWERSVSDRLRLTVLAARIRSAVAHAHDALENRLARLSLLRPDASPPLTAVQPVMTVQPLRAVQPVANKETT